MKLTFVSVSSMLWVTACLVFYTGCGSKEPEVAVTEPEKAVSKPPEQKESAPAKETEETNPIKSKIVSPKKESKPANSKPAAKAISEDPEVLAYFKKKNWEIRRDIRLNSNKTALHLGIDDDELTDEDYRMLAKTKLAQVLGVKNLTDEGAKLIAGIPQLQMLIINSDVLTDAGLKDIAACKNLDEIFLSGKLLTEAGVRELAALPKLRILTIFQMKMTGTCFEAFAASPLRTLELNFIREFTDDGARALAKLPQLQKLELGTGYFHSDNMLTSAGIRAIVETRMPPKFEFDHQLIDDDLLRLLVGKGWLYGDSQPGVSEREQKPQAAADVRYLDLRRVKAGDRGMEAVMDCIHAESVVLESTTITDETLKKLANFRVMKYLDLGKTKITGVGLAALGGGQLTQLHLGECTVDAAMLQAIAKYPNLEELWLNEAKFNPADFKHLAAAPKLKKLYLMNTEIDAAGAAQLAALTNLEELNLNDSKLDNAGLDALIKMPKLKSISLSSSQVTKEHLEKVKQANPNINFY